MFFWAESISPRAFWSLLHRFGRALEAVEQRFVDLPLERSEIVVDLFVDGIEGRLQMIRQRVLEIQQPAGVVFGALFQRPLHLVRRFEPLGLEQQWKRGL